MLYTTIERHNYNGSYTIKSTVGKMSFHGMTERQAIKRYRTIFNLKGKHINIIRL